MNEATNHAVQSENYRIRVKILGTAQAIMFGFASAAVMLVVARNLSVGHTALTTLAFLVVFSAVQASLIDAARNEQIETMKSREATLHAKIDALEKTRTR